jgi:hypothetical protein
LCRCERAIAGGARRLPLPAVYEDPYLQVPIDPRHGIARLLASRLSLSMTAVECATPEEALRAGFLFAAKHAEGHAYYHDLTGAVIDQEMVEAVEKAASAWAKRANELISRLESLGRACKARAKSLKEARHRQG